MKKYIYCSSLPEAFNIIRRENAIQRATENIKKITLKKSKTGIFSITIGGQNNDIKTAL